MPPVGRDTPAALLSLADHHWKQRHFLDVQVEGYNHFVKDFFAAVENLAPKIASFRDKRLEFSLEKASVGLTPVLPFAADGLSALWVGGGKSNMHYTFLHPAFCAQAQMDYTTLVTCRMRVKITSDRTCEVREIEGLPVFSIPLVIGSAFCATNTAPLWRAGASYAAALFDYLTVNGMDLFTARGCVMVNGKLRVIQSTENMLRNTIIVRRVKRKCTADVMLQDAGCLIAEIRCVAGCSRSTSNVELSFTHNRSGSRTLTAQISYVKCAIPVWVLLLFLGLKCMDEVRLMTANDLNSVEQTLLEGLLEVPDGVIDAKTALQWIHARVVVKQQQQGGGEGKADAGVQATARLITSNLLPICPTNEARIRLLLRMAVKLLKVDLGQAEVDDRDRPDIKSIETPGVLLYSLASQLLTRWWADVTRDIGNKAFNDQLQPENLADTMRSIFASHMSIGRHLMRACATGQWTLPKTSKGAFGHETGLCQALPTGALAGLDGKRRVVPGNPNDSQNNHAVQFDTWDLGSKCPMNTPDGQSCGSVHHLAIGFVERFQPQSWELLLLRKLLRRFSLRPGTCNTTNIFVNGVWESTSSTTASDILACLEVWRITHLLPGGASFVADGDDVCITTDSHTKCVLVVDAQQLRWVHSVINISETNPLTQLRAMGCVYSVSVAELFTHALADTLASVPDILPGDRSAFCFLGSDHIYSVSGGFHHFPNFNPGARNTLFASMQKQVFELPSHSGANRVVWGTNATPGLIQTITSQAFPEINAGQTLIVALLTDNKGATLEDGCVLSKSVSDLGSQTFITTKHTARLKAEDTLPQVNSVFEKGETLTLGSDRQVTMAAPTIVTRVEVHNELPASVPRKSTHTSTGRVVTVTTTRPYKLGIGDKVACNGQKQTISRLDPPHEMPHAIGGPQIDLIIGPCSVFSRETLAWLVEALASTYALETGDLSWFDMRMLEPTKQEAVVHELIRRLATSNSQLAGSYYIRDPVTFVKSQKKVLVAPLHVHCLQQLAEIKLNICSLGQTEVNPSTREVQGVRFAGEMEVHCLEAHGCQETLRECTTLTADGCRIKVCQACHRQDGGQEGLLHCLFCGSSDLLTVVQPYASLHLARVCQSMSIDMKQKRIS